MNRFLRSTALVILALSLSGCIAQHTTTTIAADGHGSNTIAVGVSRQFSTLIGLSGSGSDLDDLWGDLDAAVEEMPSEWQATLEPWLSDDKQYEGKRLTLQFSDLDMLRDQLGSEILGTNNALLTFDDVDVRRDGDEIVLRTTVSSALDQGVGSDETDALALLGTGGLGDTAPSFIWRIDFPGPIQAWSEQEIGIQEGNSVIYTFPFPATKAYSIEIRAKARAGLSPLMLGLVAGLIGLGVVAILTGWRLNRRNRRRAVAVTIPPSPASVMPPAYPSSATDPTPPLDSAPSSAFETGPLPTRPLTMFWDDEHEVGGERPDRGKS